MGIKLDAKLYNADWTKKRRRTRRAERQTEPAPPLAPSAPPAPPTRRGLSLDANLADPAPVKKFMQRLGIAKHMGPGDHPSGSSQDVHGRGRLGVGAERGGWARGIESEVRQTPAASVSPSDWKARQDSTTLKVKEWTSWSEGASFITAHLADGKTVAFTAPSGEMSGGPGGTSVSSNPERFTWWAAQLDTVESLIKNKRAKAVWDAAGPVKIRFDDLKGEAAGWFKSAENQIAIEYSAYEAKLFEKKNDAGEVVGEGKRLVRSTTQPRPPNAAMDTLVHELGHAVDYRTFSTPIPGGEELPWVPEAYYSQLAFDDYGWHVDRKPGFYTKPDRLSDRPESVPDLDPVAARIARARLYQDEMAASQREIWAYPMQSFWGNETVGLKEIFAESVRLWQAKPAALKSLVRSVNSRMMKDWKERNWRGNLPEPEQLSERALIDWVEQALAKHIDAVPVTKAEGESPDGGSTPIDKYLYDPDFDWPEGMTPEELLSVMSRVEKHMGPGPHPSGSDQDVHRRKTDRFGQKTARTVRRETIAQSRRIFDGTRFRPADEVLDGADYTRWENTAMERWQIKNTWQGIREMIEKGSLAEMYPNATQEALDRETESITRTIGELDSAVARWQTTEDIVLFRGRGFPAEFGKLQVGDTWANPHFVAMTSSLGDARSYAADRAEAFGFGDELVMEIRIPKGYHLGAPHLDPGETDPFEEYILPRGSKFKVRSVETLPWSEHTGETYEYVIVDLIDEFQVRKHGGGSHDDEDHGNWARGIVSDRGATSRTGPGAVEAAEHTAVQGWEGPLFGAENTMSALPEKTQTSLMKMATENLGTVEEITQRYDALMEAALARKGDAIEEWALWYEQRHVWAESLVSELSSTKRPVGIEQTLGLTAAISPGMLWEKNEAVAQAMVRAYATDMTFGEAEIDVALLQEKLNVNGKKWGRAPVIITADSRVSDIKDSKLAALAMTRVVAEKYGVPVSARYGYDSFANGVEILRGAHPGDLLPGIKTRSFYNNMLALPGDNHVTIDIMMLSAARGEQITKTKHGGLETRLNGTPSISRVGVGKDTIGVRPLLADIVRGMTARYADKFGFELMPRHVQAIIWSEWKAQQGTLDEED